MYYYVIDTKLSISREKCNVGLQCDKYILNVFKCISHDLACEKCQFCFACVPFFLLSSFFFDTVARSGIII